MKPCYGYLISVTRRIFPPFRMLEFGKQERAVAATEYATLLAVIAIGVIVSIMIVGRTVRDSYAEVGSQISVMDSGDNAGSDGGDQDGGNGQGRGNGGNNGRGQGRGGGEGGGRGSGQGQGSGRSFGG